MADRWPNARRPVAQRAERKGPGEV